MRGDRWLPPDAPEVANNQIHTPASMRGDRWLPPDCHDLVNSRTRCNASMRGDRWLPPDVLAADDWNRNGMLQ